MKVNHAHYFWGCVIEYGRGLIATYEEHDPAKAEREWQDIETVWAAHQTAFIGGEYTKEEFLWIPMEEDISGLFINENGKVLGIQQAIYRAELRHWLLPGTTLAWTPGKVLGGEDLEQPP